MPGIIENSGNLLSMSELARRYAQDVIQMLLRPGSFFKALPADRNRMDALIFLGLTAMIYSLLSILFTPARGSTLMMLYAMNALLMPVLTALVLHLLLRLFCPGRYSYDLLLGVTAYASVVLLWGWVPGFTFWAEIAKYILIALGLVKTGGISALRASGAILATVFVLVMMVYLLLGLMRF